MNERQLYPVNEVFETVQGEATYTGTPAVFVRLQGCPVGCPWCDTKHTWEADPGKVIDAPLMLDKSTDTGTYALLCATGLVNVIRRFAPGHVVLTGGEPCIHDLRPLIDALSMWCYRVQIETSGTRYIDVPPETWVTVSPKFDMPGGFPVLDHALARADEFKCPIGKAADIDVVLDRIAPLARERKAPIWLQPLSLSRRATELCIAAAMQHGWRVSLQTHKFIGIR